MRAQQKFLSRFEKWNLTKSGVASRDAIASSSRRTHLYRPGLTQKQRDGGPRRVWDLKLEDLVLDYAEMSARGEPVSRERFRADCDSLKQHMNDVCARSFCSQMIEVTRRAFGWPMPKRVSPSK